MEDSMDDKDGPITFEDLGVKTSDQTKQTLIGKVRSIESITKFEWMFLVLSLVSLLTSLGFNIQRICTLDHSSADFTFAILLLITTVFCFFYIIRGVYQECLYEILVFLITVLIVLIYCIVNYTVSSKSSIKLGRMIGVLVVGPILILLGLWICKGYHESGNFVYRTVGANAELQVICRRLLLAFSLAVFDLQLQTSLLVLVLKNGTHVSENEKIVLGVGSAIAIIYCTISFISMIFELRLGIIILWILSVFEPGYIIYKIQSVHKANNYKSLLRDCLYGAAIIALIIRLFFVFSTIMVFKNFGKGLKQKVHGSLRDSQRQPLRPEKSNSYHKYTSPDDVVSADLK